MFHQQPDPNRIAAFFSQEPEPPRQSVADKLLCGAYGVKVELMKFTDDEGVSECTCSVELHASVEGDPADVLACLLSHFRNGGGEAVGQ